MKRVILFCALLVVIVIAFLAGTNSASLRQTKSDVALHEQLVALDQSFLTNVTTRPNAMTSGSYTFEVRLAGKPAKSSVIELEFSNGRLSKGTGIPDGNIVQTGNVISFVRVEGDEGPFLQFVGVIDGNEMWGRVYQEPGDGWHQGEPPNYGVWRLQPKPAK